MPAIELVTENAADRIALRGVRVKAKIAALSLKATVEQTFVNLEDRAIEAVYTFPLPEGAAVCGFEVITGDRVLTGTIDETDAAMKKYDEAIEQGHGAFAMESDRPDVFTVRVGNLKPHQAATIRISYVSALDRVDRAIRVAFPTTVAPRYATSSGMNPIDAAIEGDALNPPHVWAVPYGLTMELDIDLKQRVRSITSPTHAISPSPLAGEGRGEGKTFAVGSAENANDCGEFTSHPNPLPQGERGMMRVTAHSVAMDRDIVLSIELEKEHEPSLEVVRDTNGDQFLAVSFVPEFDFDELGGPAASETVFVLDCSGSMQGESIHQATLALELCLRALNPGDYFNICRFGSTFEMMSSEPLKYSSETLTHAVSYVRRGTDLGGTELLAPLHAIFATKPAARVRNVVLLTDGQVSNEPAIIELARKHRKDHRIFSFGIGSACSAFLVKGLARGTGGAAEFISGRERIEEKVLRTFSRIASPMLSDVHIDWGGAEVQTLAELPPVFDGELMTVFGKVAGARLPKTVSLNGELSGSQKSWQVPVPPVRDDADRLIPTLWARRMIQSIEEVNNITRSAVRSNETRERKLLIDLSKQYSVLCSLTTFVAIEHRSIEERNEGKPELRRVPVQLAAGWGGLQEELMDLSVARCAPAAMPMMSAPASAMKPGGLIDMAKRAIKSIGSPRQRYASTDGVAFGGSAYLADREPPMPPDPCTALLLRQQAEGYFDRDTALEELFKESSLQWNDAWVGGATVSNPRVRGTVMALQILMKRFAQERSLWQRAAAKAERWLAKQLKVDTSQLRKWMATA